MNYSKVENVKKIAVLRANALGDFLFAMPALEAIKAEYPDAELVYLGKQWHKDFLAKRPGPVDRVIVIPKVAGVGAPEDTENNNEELESFFEEMRKEEFDIAIQMHGGGGNSNPFLKKLDAKLTVGTKSKDAIPLDRYIPYVFYQYEILRYLEIVNLIGVKPLTVVPKINLIDSDIEEAEKVLKDVNKPFIIIHPAASDSRRWWPAKKFAVTADSLAEKGYEIVIVGVEGERDVVEKVIQNMKHKPVNLLGKLTLGGLAGVLSKASLLIANDSGPMHLANALNVPNIGIYWGINQIMAGQPRRSIHRPLVSWKTRCEKCYKDYLNEDTETASGYCEHITSVVDNVTVHDVLNAANELLIFSKQTAS